MIRLLYHGLTRTSTDTSPFDDAVLRVARTGEVRIVSPYIGVSYLERIIQATTDWRLISDVEAWLSSLSVRSRPRAWAFIRENVDRIHHCDAIHAKTVIGADIAMLGSANLTEPGILSRTELGVLLEESKLVAELRDWFEGLWAQTAPPSVDEASAFVSWLDEEARKSPARRQKFALAGEVRKIRAQLIQIEPLARPPKEEALELSFVAQELLIRDEAHYSSVEAQVQAAIDKLATAGFGLGDLLRLVPSSSAREAYFLLIQHCANHPRSVFVDSTINRLILTNGWFVQSDKDRLVQALAPYDNFLVRLIRHIGFDEPIALEPEQQMEAATGIVGRDQVILTSELIDCGLLWMQDLPGELPRYALVKDFDWTGRFLHFMQAASAWRALKEKPRLVKVVEPDDNFVVEAPLDYEPDLEQFGWTEEATGQSMAEAFSAVEKGLEEGKRVVRAKRDHTQAQILRWLLAEGGHARVLSGKKISQQLASAIDSQQHAVELVFKAPKGEPSVVRVETIAGTNKKRFVVNRNIALAQLVNYPETRAVFEPWLTKNDVVGLDDLS